MNYQVILNDQVNIIISNVEYIEIKNEFVSFHDEKGHYVAGFKLEGITGFFTMDQPALDTGEFNTHPINIPITIDPDIKLDLKAMAEGIKKKLGYVNPRAFELMQKGQRKEPPEKWEKEALQDFNVQMEQIYRKAKNVYRSGTITLSDVREEMNEVLEEGMRRGGVHPIGSSYHYYVRKLIKDKLQRMKGLKKNDKYHYMYDRFEEVLAKNMEECLYDYRK